MPYRSNSRIQLTFGLMLGLSATVIAHAQMASEPKQKYLPSAEQTKLLREPNGLAAVAKVVGHYESVDDVCVWGTTTLDSLISGSTQIVEGTITGSEGKLTDNGDDIATRYVMTVSRTMKGLVSNQVAFYAHGGTIEFPNGTTAHIATVESDNIGKGRQYIVFLKDEDGRKVLEAPASAVIVSSPEKNTVSTFDDKDVHTEGIRGELSKITRADLIQYILNRAN